MTHCTHVRNSISSFHEKGKFRLRRATAKYMPSGLHFHWVRSKKSIQRRVSGDFFNLSQIYCLREPNIKGLHSNCWRWTELLLFRHPTTQTLILQFVIVTKNSYLGNKDRNIPKFRDDRSLCASRHANSQARGSPTAKQS